VSGFRVGIGYDAHRLVAGRPLVLGGVAIPHDRGLDGHSDADAAAHALADALLGAAGAGDLGSHFPDTDPATEGVSSLALLERVAGVLAARGMRPVNADVTIVAQAPRLGPHVPAMRRALAKALGLAVDAVSVKAKTTEGMGFEGALEGISAYAVALVETSSRGFASLPSRPGPSTWAARARPS
jgi:2-C-methyl-D-erythritol 2,4-cyclodiphosphate synthase